MRLWVLWPSWLLFGAVTLLFAAGLEAPATIQYLPFAASLLLFGLPHGAVDHLAIPRLLGKKPWPWPVLAVGLLYLVLGGLYLTLWFVAPVAAFVLFILLTWLHWGTGDLYALRAFVSPGGPAGSRRQLGATALLRGGIPMFVPLVAFPGVYRGVAEGAVGLFGSAGVPDWPFGTGFRFAVAAMLLLLAVVAFLSGPQQVWGDRRADLAETVVLVAFFAVVPPVLAVGLYFCLWHGLRHVARLALLDGKGAAALERGDFLAALARFYRDAAPLTILALLLLAAMWSATPEMDGSAGSVLGVYLVLISALTLPHAAVVLLMDVRQRSFSRAGSTDARGEGVRSDPGTALADGGLRPRRREE